MGGSARQGWDDALARLEADLVGYESLLKESGTVTAEQWTPPQGLGPIPAELVPRARAVLERQAQLRTALGTALHANTRQRGLAARIAQATTEAPVPSYLDVSA